MAVGKKSTRDVHCNVCSRATIHTLVAQHRVSRVIREADCEEQWWAAYDLFECNGCKDVTLKVSASSTEDGSDRPHVEYYPPRIARRFPQWLYGLEDKDLFELFQEVYAALHADSRRLAMMGCRAILDRIIQEQVGDQGNFKAMLKTLEDRRLISQPDKLVLDAAIDAGSASAHRGYLPEPTTLELVVDIVEHLTRSLLLRDAPITLKRVVPARGVLPRDPPAGNERQ